MEERLGQSYTEYSLQTSPTGLDEQTKLKVAQLYQEENNKPFQDISWGKGVFKLYQEADDIADSILHTYTTI